MSLPSDPIAPSETVISFDGQSNLLATEGNTPGTFEYVIASFDQSFSQHFSEGTFGVNIPFVYVGFDITASAYAALIARLDVGPGTLGIHYDIAVSDMRAPGGAGAQVGDRALPSFIVDGANVANLPTWNTNFSFVGADLTPDGSNTAIKSSLDLDFEFSFGVNNFRAGVDLYFDDFGVGPFTLIPTIGTGVQSVPIFQATPGQPDGLTSGAFVGTLTAAELPRAEQFGPDTLTDVGGILPQISTTGVGDAFAHAEFDIAKFIGELLGVSLSNNISIVDGFTFEYVILSVKIESDLKVGQTITFTPSGVGIDIVTSVKTMQNGTADGFTGERVSGQLGDTFQFDTPGSGAGVMQVDVDYTLHGTLTVQGEILATAGFEINALSAVLRNTNLKDFAIGVGPLINLEVPEGGLPLGGVDAYNRSINLSIAGTHQSFDFYWEKPVVGTPGPDNVSLNDQQLGRFNGGGGDDIVQGNTFANDIRGDGGNDVIVGNAGNDFLRGDSGADIIAGDAGIDVIYGGSGNDTLSGGLGNDSLFGMTGVDALLGNEGNDSLSSVGDNGADRIEGGAGYDTALIDRQSSFDSEVLDLRVAEQIVNGAALWTLSDGTTLTGTERLIYRGGKAADVIVTSGTSNIVSGGGGDDLLRSIGDDVFDGQAGDDQIAINLGTTGDYRGGGGSDRLIVDAQTNAAVNIDFGAVFAGSEALPGAPTILEFEHVTYNAGAGADTIFGGFGDDILRGNTGADVLFSGQGKDQLFGGSGDDLLSSDTYLFGQTPQLQPNGTIRLVGPVESDLLDGGEGNDIARVDRSTRSGFRLEFGDADEATLSDGGRLLGIESLIYLGSSGVDTVRGSRGADTIGGGGGRDKLDGGAGRDTVEGGNGDDRLTARSGEMAGDTYRGGAGVDDLEVDFSAVGVGLSLDLSLAGVQVVIPGQLTFSEFERYQITGTALADTLFGGDAEADPSATNGSGGGSGAAEDVLPFADRLIGGAGDDLIDGGGGRDFLSAGDGNDRIYMRGEGADLIDGGAGVDTLLVELPAGAGYTITLLAPDEVSLILGAKVANVERLVVNGLDTAITVQGGVGHDVVFGSSAADVLRGGQGGDEIVTGAGIDFVDAGEGDDHVVAADIRGTLIGGAGYDRLELTGNAVARTLDMRFGDGGSVTGFESCRRSAAGPGPRRCWSTA